MLTYGTIAGLERLCMPVLFKEISLDLNLNLVSIGLIWGIDPLAGIFLGLPGGLLVDRFGLKRTLTVICILGGVFSACRGFSFNFITLAATTFLFGMVASMTPVITPKATALWFDRNRLGLANALINISFSIGLMIATMTSATFLSPWLGGWKNVLFVLGIPAAIIGVLWIFTGREPEKNERETLTSSRAPFRQILAVVIRKKEVWVYGFLNLALWGANMGFLGYFPLYLRNIGWTPIAADGAMTAFNAASMLGTIPMVMLATRLKNYKMMLLFSMIIMCTGMAFIPLVNGGQALWALVIISSFLRAGCFSMVNVLIFETEGIGGSFAGTALGLASTVGMVGSFVAPPLGNSLTAFGPGVPFLFWAGIIAASFPLFWLLRRGSGYSVRAWAGD
jgi:MFS transporter, NNP family, nitrate/nitrite transporter